MIGVGYCGSKHYITFNNVETMQMNRQQPDLNCTIIRGCNSTVSLT